MNIEDALNKKPFGIVGHRGAKGVKPENTISAIKYGIEAGVDIVVLSSFSKSLRSKPNFEASTALKSLSTP